MKLAGKGERVEKGQNQKGHRMLPRLAGILQKRYAVDTIAQSKSGAMVCIEEKVVRWGA